MQTTYPHWNEIIAAILEGSLDSDGYYNLTPAEDNRLFVLAREHGGLNEEEANQLIATGRKQALRRFKVRQVKSIFRFLWLIFFVPLPAFILAAVDLYTPLTIHTDAAVTKVVLAILYGIQALLLIPSFKRSKPTAHDFAVRIWKSRDALPHGARDAVKMMNTLFEEAAQSIARQESAKPE